MDPAGVTQQRSLEQIRETLLQGEQALAEQREYIIQQKDPARQQEDIARYLRYMQRLEQVKALLPPSLHFPVQPGPPHYNGNPGGCRRFLLQCHLELKRRSVTLSSERSRIVFMIVLLSGKALALATAIWEKQGPECSSLRAFQAVMLWVYDRVTMDSFEAAIASALERDAALNPALCRFLVLTLTCSQSLPCLFP